MFDPFNDRKARDLRNELSRQFIKALQIGDLSSVKDFLQGKNYQGEYAAYISSRLQRYQSSVKSILQYDLTDILEKFCVLWNKRLYFECHELLEKRWMALAGSYRKALQGLIQAAGYFIHLERNAPSAAKKIGARAIRNIRENRECFPHWLDVDRICHCIDKNNIIAPQLRIPKKRNKFMTLPAFVSYLLEEKVYPYPVDKVDLVQTHISYVLLAGDFVYKFKKPVDFGFLDFTTLEKRKFYCEQELVLNRRLCPDIYLDTVTVNRQDGKLTLNGPGDVVEYGIKMHRMPEEGMMTNIIKAGALDRKQIQNIVATLVPFYEKAADSIEIKNFGKAKSVAVNVLENFEQTEGFIGCDALNQEQYSRISSYAKGFLANEDLFEKRRQAGRIRDCHGDLYSANICLDGDKVYVFDCIEFNERFRFSDVASDVAFLAMDLDFHGLSDLSKYFIEQFIKESADPDLLEMLNFYKCYRAYVRGKIGLFTAHDPQVDAATKQNCLSMAKRYFELADHYAS